LGGSLALAAGKEDAVALALDEVHTLTFRTPVATVYVGNPSIADVTMIDARHAFVQGKGYGRTNIMALNRDNVMVFNTHVSVTGNNSGGTVTLNRGSQRVTLNCAGGRCEQTPTPGDGKDYDTAVSQLTGHQSAARGAAIAEAKN
jgi:Flp pilus assembly secretin CpaC